jgi:hypothetical protein
MNLINYESTMLKYGVSDLFMSDLATLILERKTLTESLDFLSGRHDTSDLTLKQIYVLASSIATSIMGDELSVIAPEMYYDRLSMNDAAVDNFKLKRKYSSSNESETSSLEDILEEIEEAVFEMAELKIA